jgi:hypothetical protein
MKALGGCLINLGLWTIVATIGALCVNYDLYMLFHKTIPFGWAFLLNIVVGPVSITLAIVLKVLTLLGVLAG